jgi:8-oxo-dGTP pyrophosphatase MutT (NUDIX family)
MKTTRCASVVIEENGKLLLQQRSDKKGIDLIGGHIDPGETPEQAAVREAREEANVDVGLGRLICHFVWKDDDGEHEEWMFEAKILSGKPSGSEEGEVLWLSLQELDKRKIAFPLMMEKFLEFYENSSK